MKIDEAISYLFAYFGLDFYDNYYDGWYNIVNIDEKQVVYLAKRIKQSTNEYKNTKKVLREYDRWRKKHCDVYSFENWLAIKIKENK